MQKRITGFTLIELMISVAIIGILSAIAVPTFKDYTKYNKVSEAIRIANPAKLSVAEYFGAFGNLPATNLAAGMPAAVSIVGVYTSDLTISNGDITVTIKGLNDAAVDGKTLTLTPSTQNGIVEFSCAGSVPNKFLPPDCRS